MKMKKMILISIPIFLLFGCGNQNKEHKPVISTLEGSYTIDVHSYPALAGNADYVIIGKVVDELEVNYKWPVMIENEDGSEREDTVPYTDYSVEVIENLKGELTQEEPITITKEGGVTKDGEFYILHNDDTLPAVGNEYVFYVYAQEDGSNLVSGPNSSIPIENNDGSEITTRTVQEDESNVLDQVKEGIENQIETKRIKSISNDDVSVN